MSQSIIQNEKLKKFGQDKDFDYSNKWVPITHWNETPKNTIPYSICRPYHESNILTVFKSQLLLFNSRKKWGLLFAVATISGMFCVPSALAQIQSDFFGSLDYRVSLLVNYLLPVSTLLIITGMYVLNDLVDADLDRINGKTKRPIPSGKVSKGNALLFVTLTTVTGLSVPIFANNLLGIIFASIIALIGILYSLPKVSLKDRFIVKTCVIGIAMACSLLLGASINLKADSDILIGNAFYWIGNQLVTLIPYPAFAAVMLAMMVFVTSPLNDLGDIKGDRKAGRKTIPIVIGKKNTLKLSLLLTIGMALSAWMLYAYSNAYAATNTEIHHNFNAAPIALPLAVTGTCILIIFHLLNVLRRMNNQDYIRQSVTKRSIPLHLLLQISLVISCLLS